MAEVRNWQPGWIDRARWSAQGMLAPLFGGDERAALAYVDDKVKPTLEYMPGVGDAMAAAEARDAFSQGDYLGGGLLAAGAAAGLVPGVGDAVQKGMKKAMKQYPVAPRGEWWGDANYEQTGGRLVEMSPDEFLQQVRPLQIDDVSRENIDDLKRHMMEGRTLDPLQISAKGKEDGRHRAYAAKELGIDSVPVLVWVQP